MTDYPTDGGCERKRKTGTESKILENFLENVRNNKTKLIFNYPITNYSITNFYPG